jgi:flagellar assembly factor FliW
MDIESTRFGTFQVRDDLVLTFPDGLPGLPGERYVLVAQDEGVPFYWLHSAEHADVALPVTNPWLFFADYEVHISDEEARMLGLESPEEADIYCVVRATPDLGDCTVNLASPVIIQRSNRLGRQIINDAGGYSVRHRLFSEVELDEAKAMAAGISVPVEATAV